MRANGPDNPFARFRRFKKNIYIYFTPVIILSVLRPTLALRAGTDVGGGRAAYSLSLRACAATGVGGIRRRQTRR